jgi:hypothetical protein
MVKGLKKNENGFNDESVVCHRREQTRGEKKLLSYARHEYKQGPKRVN